MSSTLLKLFSKPPRPSIPPRFTVCPTPGAADLLELVSSADALLHLRAQAETFQFYAGHFMDPSPSNVGPNTSAALLAIDAPRRLRDVGFRLSLEVGVLKQWSTDPTGYVTDILDRVQRAGGVDVLTMDEPLTASVYHLGWPDEQTADHVATVVHDLRAQLPGVEIGLIEAVPALSLSRIVAFVDYLIARDAAPSFVDVDVDAHHAAQVGWTAVTRGLRFWRDAVQRDRQIPCGVLVWGFDDANPVTFVRDGRALIDRFQQVFERDWPRRVVVQSWGGGGGADEALRDVPPCGLAPTAGTLWELLQYARRQLA